MALFEIPKLYYTSFEELLRLEQEGSIEGLISALKELEPEIRTDALSGQVARTLPQLSHERISMAMPLIVSLYLLCDRTEQTASELSADLIESLSDTREIEKPEEWKQDSFKEQFANHLTQILSINGALTVAAKAVRVLMDHKHVFCSARVLTDIRPVFSADIEPKAAVIVHTLRIDYHEEGEHKSFYVALDNGDIQRLKEVLSRAESKEESLKPRLKKSDITFLDTRKPE